MDNGVGTDTNGGDSDDSEVQEEDDPYDQAALDVMLDPRRSEEQVCESPDRSCVSSLEIEQNLIPCKRIQTVKPPERLVVLLSCSGRACFRGGDVVKLL